MCHRYIVSSENWTTILSCLSEPCLEHAVSPSSSNPCSWLLCVFTRPCPAFPENASLLYSVVCQPWPMGSDPQVPFLIQWHSQRVFYVRCSSRYLKFCDKSPLTETGEDSQINRLLWVLERKVPTRKQKFLFFFKTENYNVFFKI